MAPGSNKAKSGSTGLKILWIPGRKKQHDKGTYKPTNYKIEHKHTDKRVESWSLGGSNAQNEIAAGKDKDDEITTPTSAILPSASASVAAVNVENCSDDDDEIHLARPNNLDSIDRLDETDYVNGVSSKGKCTSSKKKYNDDDHQKPYKEEKIVKFLYCTQQCCECTIS